MCSIYREKTNRTWSGNAREVSEYEEMINIMKDKDIEGRTVFSLVMEFKLIQFLEHPILNGIINDQWTTHQSLYLYR